jgi:pentatricopeptide repeat protein
MQHRQNAALKSAARPEDLLEAMFEQSLKGSSDFGGKMSHESNTANLQLYEHIDKLHKMLDEGKMPIPELWSFFVTNLGPEAWSNFPFKPSSFSLTARNLRHKLLAARRQIPVEVGMPTVSEITRTYAKLGLLKPEEWKSMLWTLFEALRVQRDDPQAMDDLIEDILATWTSSLYIHGRSKSTPMRRPMVTDSKLPFSPPLHAKQILQHKATGGIGKMFRAMRPEFAPAACHAMATSAIVTFGILTDFMKKSNRDDLKTNPVIVAISKILAIGRVNPIELSDYLKFQNVTLLEELDIGLLSIIESVAQSPAITKHVSGVYIYQRRRLIRATASKDIQTVNRMWDEAKAQTDSNTGNVMVKIRPELYNQFILSYMSLHKPDMAIAVWNDMISCGIEPTLSSWNAMLEGCKIARDARSLETIWTKLLGSGLKPDIVCWTTRVSGLMYCGKIDMALQALEQMRSAWILAAKTFGTATKLDIENLGDVNGYVKPTISVINAAVSGLLRHNHMDKTQRLLEWGGQLGIAPDIITYNTILRGLIKNGGDPDTIAELQRQMQSEGVRADVATFSTMLDKSFLHAEDYTASEQVEIVHSVFAEMEAAGVTANATTYAAMIRSLLQLPQPELAPVNTVLDRMAKQGLEPSPYIYTMLITHYFSQEPQDLDAVHKIVETIRAANKPMDHIFWDRLIEGYCWVGHTGNALKILAQVSKNGIRAGWPALEMVIRALCRNDEYELAREVVRNTFRERGGPPHPALQGMDGQHSFWYAAEDLGLMRGLDEVV